MEKKKKKDPLKKELHRVALSMAIFLSLCLLALLKVFVILYGGIVITTLSPWAVICLIAVCAVGTCIVYWTVDAIKELWGVL